MSHSEKLYARLIFIGLIMLTSMLGIFISDIYIPSMPIISDEFNVSERALSNSVTYYFLIFALSQLIYGPLSEKYGRKKIFTLGLMICLGGTLIVLFSTNFWLLMIGRTLQAIGMASPMSLGRVILRDITPDQKQFSRLMSFLGVGTLLAPVMAPILGAFLAYHYGWRSDFIFILLLSLLCFIVTLASLKETLLNPKKRISAKLSVQTYIWVIKNKQFIKNTMIASCVMSAIIAYLSASPFLLQNFYGLDEMQYAMLFGLGELFIAIGMLYNGLILKYISINQSQKIAIFMFLISGFMILIQFIAVPHSLFFLMISIILFNFSAGIIFPTSSTLAIIAFKTRLGAVGSLYGCITMLIAGASSTLILFIPLSENALISLFIFVASIISFSLFCIKENDSMG